MLETAVVNFFAIKLKVVHLYASNKKINFDAIWSISQNGSHICDV